MEKIPIDRNVRLEKSDGKELLANMTLGDQISAGGLADIYMATVKLGDRSIPLIFKEYRASTAEDNARRAFANYRIAKEAKLKVFTTFRLVREDDSYLGIIMTNGTANETICLASNYSGPITVEDYGVEKLKTIKNSKELIDGIFTQAILANEKSIYLDPDCFFFLVKNGNPNIDFVIGDMDHVKKERGQEEIRESETIHSAYVALESFFQNNILDPSTHLSTLTQKFREVMKQYKLPYIYKHPEEKD